MSVDEDRFRALVLKQRETARASRKSAGADAWAGDADVLENLEGATIGGKTFDLADYPHNSDGKPQMIWTGQQSCAGDHPDQRVKNV